MNWTETLTQEANGAYHAAEGLVRLVEDAKLGWKPATGDNWMTTGQLLEHVGDACGLCCKAFLTNDWSVFGSGPIDASQQNELGMPLASALPTAKSVRGALEKLAADRRTALEAIRTAGEDDLAGKMVTAPWDPVPAPLGLQFLRMINHLNNHKGQLFYYLKLQGRPVHTGHLYGMT